MKSKRQANQIQPDDIVNVSLQFRAKACAAPSQSNREGFVRLFLRPMPCGEICGDNCDCNYGFFSRHLDGPPFQLAIFAGKRLQLYGNEAQAAKEVARLQAFLNSINVDETNDQGTETARQIDKDDHSSSQI